METQLQKYNGKGIANCSVKINFDTKSVRFIPCKHNSNVINFLVSVFANFMIILVVFAIFSIIFRFRVSTINTLLIILVLSFLISIVSIPYGLFPKLAEFHCNCILPWQRRKKVICYKSIKNKRYTLKNISIVGVYYELSGDTASQIKTIHLKNKDRWNSEYCDLIFEFKRQPTSGFIKINYHKCGVY